jgi:uncharacterized repeat protein (TIGR03803 family)
MKSSNALKIHFQSSVLRAALLGSCVLRFSGIAFGQRPDHVLYRFEVSNDGLNPVGNLAVDGSGNLYGTTSAGGAYGGGAVYQLSPPQADEEWSETVLFDFSLSFGTEAFAGGLIIDQSGNLYGTTWLGGPNGGGDVFELSPPGTQGGAWTGQVLYDFSAPNDGYSPETPLAFDSEGNLYGTTSVGGNNPNHCEGGCGTVFKLTAPSVPGGNWTETVLYDFPGSGGETGVGGTLTGVTVGPDGSVYGTTLADPGMKNSPYGNILRLTPQDNKRGTYKFSILYKFGLAPAPDGYFPAGGVILDRQGNVYGTTAGGGTQSAGTVFQLTYSANDEEWTETILYNFTGGADGGAPEADLTMDRAGNLYGTTTSGGDFSCGEAGCGTVFKLSPPTQQGDAWTETTLHQFAGGNDGAFSAGSVIFGLRDHLYGATGFGGSSACNGYGCGTVFSLNR